jgi:MFS family permease
MLLRAPGFRRLLGARLATQWGDGMFQAGLAGAVVFSPERQADPLAIATAFTVLLLPYSLVGPFAGALLDRWDRRRVLLAASVLRALAILTAVLFVASGLVGTGLYVTALVVVALSRFMASGLSASLPHVVPDTNLVEGNAIATTSGAIFAVFGAASGVGLRALVGAGDSGVALSTSVAILGALLAAWLVMGFPRGALGPDEVDEPSQTIVAVAYGLVDGARAALAAPRVAAGFVALIAHRAAFGMALLVTVLLLRYRFQDTGPLKAGLPGLGEIALAGGLGILCAGLVTARIAERFGLRRTVLGSLVFAAAALALFGLPLQLPTVLIAAFTTTAAGQVVKLCVDSAVQHDIHDDHRGRVFALYDTLFNITQVLAVTAAATVVPPDGHSRFLVAVAVGIYLVGMGGYLLAIRRPVPTPN